MQRNALSAEDHLMTAPASLVVQVAPADLIVDRIYRGGRSGNASDDPLSKLLGVSNQGGFRYLGNPDDLKMVVVTSNFADPDWPDHFDRESGLFTYFGDNKSPGRLLVDTPRRGNLLLQRIFDAVHVTPAARHRVPPILVFRNAGTYRDVEFLGLAVPGAEQLPPTEDLVAVWRVTRGQRFQNYRAVFTILDAAVISRNWIQSIQQGNPLAGAAPEAWRTWVFSGYYQPLRAARTIEYRTKAQQLPGSTRGRQVAQIVYEHFKSNPIAFEKCACEIARFTDRNFLTFDLTRPTRDGGRDGIGAYRIGAGPSAIIVDCALEAKCYAPEHSVGVKEVARLISRLRHRQFGVLVTTSYVHQQAYEEIKADQHPVVIIAARDVVEALEKRGLTDVASVRNWLQREFTFAPMSPTCR